MQPASFVSQVTGLPIETWAKSVTIRQDGDRVWIDRWDADALGVPQPTDAAFAAALAAPEPPPTVAALLAYASAKQDTVLAQVWSFDVGTAAAPMKLTTNLDPRGQAAMTKLALWAIMNASSSGATEAYSNVDFTPFTVTPAQALSVATQAGAAISASYAALNATVAAINATPPTIATFTAIDAAPWPAPAP